MANWTKITTTFWTLSWFCRPWEGLLTTTWTERGGAYCLTSWRRTLEQRFPARSRGPCRFHPRVLRTRARATQKCRAQEMNDKLKCQTVRLLGNKHYLCEFRSCLLEVQNLRPVWELYVLLMEESVWFLVEVISVSTCAVVQRCAHLRGTERSLPDDGIFFFITLKHN